MFYKTAWYDFMGDVKDAPIFNSEDHIIGDRSKLYSDKENAWLAAFVGADMWQGAIHGRDASTIWVWERSFDPTVTSTEHPPPSPNHRERRQSRVGYQPQGLSPGI
jgi:hypothetical protein